MRESVGIIYHLCRIWSEVLPKKAFASKTVEEN